jgi:hypothetical protein
LNLVSATCMNNFGDMSSPRRICFSAFQHTQQICDPAQIGMRQTD